MNDKPTQIFFYKIKDNASKIKCICHLSEQSFHSKKRLMITAPHLDAANYLEELLWKLPAGNFLPHVVTDMPTMEWIAISLQNKININQAKQLLNLCNFVPQIYDSLEVVHELLDETHPEKLNESKKKFERYVSLGMNIKIIDM